MVRRGGVVNFVPVVESTNVSEKNYMQVTLEISLILYNNMNQIS